MSPPTIADVVAMLNSMADRQVQEFHLAQKRDVAIHSKVDAAVAEIDRLRHRVDRTEATATGTRKSVSDAEATNAFETQALKNTLTAYDTKIASQSKKLDALVALSTQANQEMGTSVTALILGSTKQQQAARTSALVAILFAVGQLIQLWRAH